MRLLPHGATIGKAKVIVDIVPKGNPEIRPGTKITATGGTVHNTGNTGKGANALAHNQYIHNMADLKPKDTRHASWHVTVDESYIIQHIPFDELAWHCGDGAKGPGNTKTIGFEICHHSDQKSYAQAEENTIALIAYLVKQGMFSGNAVYPHQKWSGKYCPQVILRRDGSFTKFHQRILTAIKIGTNITKGDEDILKFTSSTTRNRLRSNVKAWVDGGLIGKQWLTSFDKGEMTNGDYVALEIIAAERKSTKK